MGYKERPNYEGDYVCLHCHLIYQAYGSRLRCDICNRKLKYLEAAKVEEYNRKWQEQDKGRISAASDNRIAAL